MITVTTGENIQVMRKIKSALDCASGKLLASQHGRMFVALLSIQGSLLLCAQSVQPSGTPIFQQQSGSLQRGSDLGQHLGQPSLAPEDVAKLKLTPGSSIQLHVFEEPDLDGTYRIDDQGFVALPLAGRVKLASLTLSEAEFAIDDRLVEGEILKVAHSTVNLDEFTAQNITVVGEVASPGRYPVLAPRQLIDVIALAGGETAMAGNEVVIHRQNEPSDKTETIHYGRGTSDPNALSVTVEPGDSVLVKRAGIVYVLGSVNRPGGYLMQEAGKLNFDEALALALGTAPEAKVGDIRIFRKQPDGSVVQLPANYHKINKGKAGQIELQSEDIIFVPSSALKSALIRGTQVIASAASATIYTVY